jgi:hypothetical protein
MEVESGVRAPGPEGANSRMNDWVGVLVAIAATMMAIGNIKDGNVG